jgi:U6 snRNA-associated Sm-like protein LSm1
LDKDDYIPPPFKKASAAEVHQLTVKQANERKEKEKKKQRKLGEHGFEVEHAGEVLF